METRIDEIAPDIFRLSTYISEANLQFNQFLIRDEEPLLFHTGLNSLFPLVLGGVQKLIKPEKLRWISFSHFEADECGSVNRWLELAPEAQVINGFLGNMLSLNDFSIRPPRSLENGEKFSTGTKTYQYISTPHLPHGWDAGMLFEETTGTLLCSDLFHQNGQTEAMAGAEVLEGFSQTFRDFRGGPLDHYMPYTPQTEDLLAGLAALKPTTMAIMHGASFKGDGEKLLLELREFWKKIAI
jgi:flavorubredoxin